MAYPPTKGGRKRIIVPQQAPTVHVSSKSAYHGPDVGLVRYQLARLQNEYKLLGPAIFSEKYLWILRKNPEPGEKDLLAKAGGHWNRRLIPFKHNHIQLDLDANMALRNILLKPRQGGYTTYILLMRLLIPAIIEPGSGNLLISQNYKYVAHHFAMLQRAFKMFGVKDPFDSTKNWWAKMLHDNLLHTSYSNRREIILDQLDSRIICESAENEEAGQGVTVQHVSADEVARWPGKPEETLANLKEAIPANGTLDLLSTANGQGGYFYQECMRSRDPLNKDLAEFKYFFHPWSFHEEYREDKAVDPKTMTEEESFVVHSLQLDMYQLMWRRKKIIQLRHNFFEKYPENDLTCFLIQGNQFFDKDILAQRYTELNSEQTPDVDRYKKVTIYKKRVKNARYIIGADPATGYTKNNPDPDYSAAIVIDLNTGEEMAAYRWRLAEEEFASDLAELGRLYNNALVAVERTGYGGTTIVTLEVACQYTNLYKHRDWWKRNNQNRLMEFTGFPTTPKTRPLLLNRLRYFIHTNPDKIHDQMFVSEALSFVYNELGKPEAAPGNHDDTVMCRGIAYYVREVQLGYISPESIPSEKYGSKPSEFSEDEEFNTPDDAVEVQ